MTTLETFAAGIMPVFDAAVQVCPAGDAVTCSLYATPAATSLGMVNVVAFVAMLSTSLPLLSARPASERPVAGEIVPPKEKVLGALLDELLLDELALDELLLEAAPDDELALDDELLDAALLELLLKLLDALLLIDIDAALAPAPLLAEAPVSPPPPPQADSPNIGNTTAMPAIRRDPGNSFTLIIDPC